MQPEPLAPGHLLGERFEVRSVLGRGGFGIAYLATDTALNDDVVVKELAPEGSRRGRGGLMELHSASISPHLLRQRFLDEATTLARVNVRGVLPVRASFSENGTAYHATEYQPETETLEAVLAREGRLGITGALDIFLALLETLELVHRRGVLHRDIKPSNILLSKSGRVYLIDFGAAREFLSDANQTHTVMYTPGYAPPEQLSEKARRGPATDLYALCATLYHMLAGRPPADAAARMSGIALTPIRSLRADVDAATSRVLERGLAISYAERPQNAEELRRILATEPEAVETDSIDMLDQLLVRMRGLTFEKRACPACSGVLVDPKPLRKGVCPVCTRGGIRKRAVENGLCPVCRNGMLIEYDNSAVLAICPVCSEAPLAYRKKSLLSKEQIANCPKCSSEFSVLGRSLTLTSSGEQHTIDEWLQQSRRAASGAVCRACSAIFDELADGRWRQAVPKPRGKYISLYPEEWWRVASDLDPGAGNAECDACGADFFLESDSMTLLDAPQDPNGFARDYMGRLISSEDARWLGVGKESPQAGYVCENCPTEFDLDGNYLRLIRTNARPLIRYEGQPKTLEDWHRLGQGLPSVDQEDSVSVRLDEQLREAYRRGEIGFDDSGQMAWKGDAVRQDDGGKGALTISADEVVFGGLLRKWRVPRDAVLHAEGEENTLRLWLSGERDWLEFELAPMTLYAQLKSGERALALTAEDLSQRLDPRQAK